MTRFTLPRWVALLLSIMMLAASPGAAADEQTQQIIDARQGLLKVVRSYFGPIVGMARQQIPYDAEVVAGNAEKIAQLAEMIPDMFRADTSETELESGALEHIWDNYDDFAEKAATVAGNARALQAAAGEDQGAAMKAFGQLGASCKACHDEYRQQQ